MARIMARYNLKFPIIRETRTTTGEELEETLRPEGFCVLLKRPRGKDVKMMDEYEGRQIAGSMALLARITNLSEDEIELLDADDLGELGNLLNGGSESGPTTGPSA